MAIRKEFIQGLGQGLQQGVSGFFGPIQQSLARRKAEQAARIAAQRKEQAAQRARISQQIFTDEQRQLRNLDAQNAATTAAVRKGEGRNIDQGNRIFEADRAKFKERQELENQNLITQAYIKAEVDAGRPRPGTAVSKGALSATQAQPRPGSEPLLPVDAHNAEMEKVRVAYLEKFPNDTVKTKVGKDRRKTLAFAPATQRTDPIAVHEAKTKIDRKERGIKQKEKEAQAKKLREDFLASVGAENLQAFLELGGKASTTSLSIKGEAPKEESDFFHQDLKVAKKAQSDWLNAKERKPGATATLNPTLHGYSIRFSESKEKPPTPTKPAKPGSLESIKDVHIQHAIKSALPAGTSHVQSTIDQTEERLALGYKAIFLPFKSAFTGDGPFRDFYSLYAKKLGDQVSVDIDAKVVGPMQSIAEQRELTPTDLAIFLRRTTSIIASTQGAPALKRAITALANGNAEIVGLATEHIKGEGRLATELGNFLAAVSNTDTNVQLILGLNGTFAGGTE